MKNIYSHISISIIFALLIVAAGWFFTLFYAYVDDLWTLIGVSAVIFILLYVTVAILLQRFEINKITPIYKTIYSIDNIRKDLKNPNPNVDLAERVNRDVVQWAAKKTEEISRLIELERFRKEFLGNVAHELKTPIFNIQGYILTLLDGGLDDPSINQTYLERTEKSVERLINITQDLDVINRLETGDMEMNKASFNMTVLVEEIFDAFEITAKKRNINLRTQWIAGGKVMVYADRKKISQVLINLIANSINYGKEGGETVVSFTDMPNRVLVEVKDNGIGISSEALPRIFERFYRVDKHRSREHGGSGLGLAIVKHIIEAHNQSINVHSELDKGTTFAFTLDKSK
ncbi:MAG: sensor histidine kinase [Prevotellaceae bacterium]|jgi:two-component system phosphate regulon sensor histidine kinase PhoR|nr:sensor histidine kinase [Prevotellaceae bacterium]